MGSLVRTSNSGIKRATTMKKIILENIAEASDRFKQELNMLFFDAVDLLGRYRITAKSKPNVESKDSRVPAEDNVTAIPTSTTS